MTPPQSDRLERIRAEAIAAAAADADNSAVIATDAQGTVAYWNDAAVALYGWRTGEVIGRNILEVTPTRNSSDEADHIMELLRRGEPWTGTFIVQHRDGAPLLVRVTDVPVRHDGEVIGVIGISRAVPRTMR